MLIRRDMTRRERILMGKIIAVFIRNGWNPPVPPDEVADRLIEDMEHKHAIVSGAKLQMRPQERRYLYLVSQGYSYKEIGAMTGRHTETVRKQIKSSYRSLGARNGPHAVSIAIRQGLF